MIEVKENMNQFSDNITELPKFSYIMNNQSLQQTLIRKKFMCPNCFNMVNGSITTLHLSTLHMSEEEFCNLSIKAFPDIYYKVSGFCTKCNSHVPEFAEIDFNIGDVIQNLNILGYRTKYCCEGHVLASDGSYSGAYIIFFGTYTEEELRLPSSWKIDEEFTKNNPELMTPVTRIEPKDTNDRINFKQAWDDLRAWIETKKHFCESN